MRTCALAVAVAAALVAAPQAQQPNLKDVLYKLGNGLGVLRGFQEEDSLLAFEYFGTGTMRELGPKTVGPAVDVKSYHAAVAYDFPGMRVIITRAGSSQPEIQVVSGTFAWNEIDKVGGGLVPGYGRAMPAMDVVADRLLRMWTTPFGVYKAAVAAADKTKVSMEGGKVVLTFPLTNAAPGPTSHLVVGELNGTPVKVTLDAASRPEQVEVRHRNRVLTTTYSGYGDLNEKDLKADIFFPSRILQTADGQTVLDLKIEKTNTYNPYVLVPVPENVQKAGGR
jgi:hypothetical protein